MIFATGVVAAADVEIADEVGVDTEDGGNGGG